MWCTSPKECVKVSLNLVNGNMFIRDNLFSQFYDTLLILIFNPPKLFQAREKRENFSFSFLQKKILFAKKILENSN